ncbi:MAG: methionyl-tRNA formyltransferase [Mariprofundaceae bacterium]|nr:methionyl-tRNA formyltransferase [Mariprofundaceae bacterium]
MKIVFAGTPPFAATCLQHLITEPSIDVVGVISQPDRKSGRGMKLTPSAVKRLAIAQHLDHITPHTLKENNEGLIWLNQKQADFLIVVAYGMIIPPAWLAAVAVAPINVHASLLPRWRGAAPIERAILAGDASTGVCIMHMEEGLDTGPVYCTTTTTIHADTTGMDLWEELAGMGADLLCTALQEIKHGRLRALPQQQQGISYAKKLSTKDRLIDWQQSPQVIDRMVRCFTPKPGARCRIKNRWLKIVAGSVAPKPATNAPAGQIIGLDDNGMDIACANGRCYRILQVQPEGKATMGAADFCRGQRLRVGNSLTLTADC